MDLRTSLTYVQAEEPLLLNILESIAKSVVGISEALRIASTEETGSSNAFGDHQLVADMTTEAIIESELRRCPGVHSMSSEESPVNTVVSSEGIYSVAFDPLDGSSIIPSNFAVGSIFGIWKGAGFRGKSGDDMVGAAYAVYGPRTVLVIACPMSRLEKGVQLYTLSADGQHWVREYTSLKLQAQKKLFAPANLRSSKGNAAYAELIRNWMEQGYTLRYTGGMVPDVHNLLVKNGGVFCNPVSQQAPAKLRLVYECLPLSYIVVAAGGCSIDDTGGSIMGRKISDLDERSPICMGSRSEVEACVPALCASALDSTAC